MSGRQRVAVTPASNRCVMPLQVTIRPRVPRTAKVQGTVAVGGKPSMISHMQR